jgi:hypothetical protein
MNGWEDSQEDGEVLMMWFLGDHQPQEVVTQRSSLFSISRTAEESVLLLEIS